jgi:hypothetical protein
MSSSQAVIDWLCEVDRHYNKRKDIFKVETK